MMTVGRFLNGFLSGTLCSAFAFYFYNSISDEDGNENPGLIRLHAKQAPRRRLKQLDPETTRTLRGNEILKYGVPERGPEVLLYDNHVLCYNQATRTPIWVAEHIIKSDLKGPADRKHSYFKVDPTLDELFSSHNSDYKSSGWSKGHMAPPGNNNFSQNAMDETFYLTNILPQDINNNGGFWNRLEIYCRGLTDRFAEVRVFSGPLMIPKTEERFKKYVKYEVIGTNNVAVPTHLFKVVVAENPKIPHSPVAVGVFVVPNEPIESSATLKQYEVQLQDLEKSAGMRFLPGLQSSKTANLCSIDSCKLIPQQTLDLYSIGRKLESAETLHRLESVWKDLERRKLSPGDYLTKLYKKKREILSQNK